MSLRYTSTTSTKTLPTRRLHLDTHNNMPLTRTPKSCATALFVLGSVRTGSSAASGNLQRGSSSSGTFATNVGQPQPRQSTTLQPQSDLSASPASLVGSSATMSSETKLPEHRSPFNRTGDRDEVSKAVTRSTPHSHLAPDSVDSNIENDGAIRYKGESTSATGGSQKPLQPEHSRASLSPQETEPTLTPEEYDAWARNEIGQGSITRIS